MKLKPYLVSPPPNKVGTFLLNQSPMIGFEKPGSRAYSLTVSVTFRSNPFTAENSPSFILQTSFFFPSFHASRLSLGATKDSRGQPSMAVHFPAEIGHATTAKFPAENGTVAAANSGRE